MYRNMYVHMHVKDKDQMQLLFIRGHTPWFYACSFYYDDWTMSPKESPIWASSVLGLVHVPACLSFAWLFVLLFKWGF